MSKEAFSFEEAKQVVNAVLVAYIGKPLETNQVTVLQGAFEGKTYGEIAATANYGEGHLKDIGYKFWALLSDALGEEVSKNNIEALKRRCQGLVDDAWETKFAEMPRPQAPARVFISYRSKNPDIILANQFDKALKAAGHQVFKAGTSNRQEDNWWHRFNEELQQCDYFLLLLFPKSSTNEKVTEEVRRVKELRDSHPDNKPMILCVRVNFSMSSPLNHDLRGYLQGIEQHEWRSPDDTLTILQAILDRLSDGSDGQVPVSVPEAEELPPVEESPDHLPLPVAEPELPGGQVKLDSAYYVERPPIEKRCYEQILEPGALIRIKAPRQMGKTSLMARILRQAKNSGCQIVPLSCQLADSQVFANLDTFLRWFCEKVGRRLKLHQHLDNYWSGSVSNDKCHYYFEECLLSEIDTPLVVGLDEVDRVFDHRQIASDFFGLLRVWYEIARYNDMSSKFWEKLRVVVVHSTEVYIPLDVNQSPFNVGMPVELKEFTREQIQDLAQRHGLYWTIDYVEQLMSMLGGHPFLLRLALYHIQRQDMTLEQVLQTAPTDTGIYSDHLRRHLWNLQQYPELLAAFSQVVTAQTPVKLESGIAFKLDSMGLVHLDNNDVTPRCNLYRQYFRER